MADQPPGSHQDRRRPDPIVSLYVKLFVGTLAFGTLVHFLYLDITRPGITVPAWVFVMLLAIMGSMLGVDILDQYRGVE